MALSLFQRIGGEDMVRATVVKLYEKILADATLIPFFEHINVHALRNSQIAFITMAFGGEHKYTGKDLRQVHSNVVKQGLNDTHFDTVVKNLTNSMQELEIAADLIKEVIAVVETTRSDVLGK